MDPADLLLTAARASFLYFLLLFVVRTLGKREVGNITAFDLIVAFMLGEVADEIIFGDVTIAQGAVAIGTVAVWELANSWSSFKSPLIDRLTGSQPTVLVEHGRLNWEGMQWERMNEEELWSALRLRGVDDLAEVKRATLEPNGQVSVIKERWAEPVQKGDLEMSGDQGG